MADPDEINDQKTTTRKLLSYEAIIERGQIVSNAGGGCHQQNAQNAELSPEGAAFFCSARRIFAGCESIQELEVLPHEVAADVLRIGVDKLLGDRSRRIADADTRTRLTRVSPSAQGLRGCHRG